MKKLEAWERDRLKMLLTVLGIQVLLPVAVLMAWWYTVKLP